MEIETAANEHVVLDAGSGIRALVIDWNTRKTISDHDEVSLFLTHRHLDHVIGLPQFLPLLEPSACVRIRCGNSTPEEMSELLHELLSPPLFVKIPARRTVQIEPCTSGTANDVGPHCRVHRFDARHNGGAAVFRVDDEQGAAFAFAPDNELSYSSDDESVSAWRRDLSMQLHGVPVLMHDATFTDKELPSHSGWGHSSPQEATRFAMECEARRLILCHHHPDRTDNDIDALLRECRAMAAESGSALVIDAAYEGMTLVIE